MFTLCYYAAIMLPLNEYYAAINLSCYYAAVILLLVFIMLLAKTFGICYYYASINNSIIINIH